MIAPDQGSPQLHSLQAQHLALLHDYQILQDQFKQQQQATRDWLERRTRELQAEAQEQKKAETLQRIFYRIAERATAGLSFYDFLQAVHGLLGELLYAKNCYVCLYDAHSQTKDFPYYVDERDGDSLQLSKVPFRRGLTEFVLRSARPQLIDQQRLLVLQAQGEVTEGSGDMSFTSWLGVPMQINGVTAGVLTVQGYEPGVRYGPADADILSFVANHVSSAIERYQTIDELRKSEARYRLVIESVGVGVVVVQDGRMVFANPSLVRIVGYPLDYLLSQPYTVTIHPDDVAEVVTRHQRRLRGEPVEHYYGFRIITKNGQTRWLELSAVMIDWGERPATLMFVVDASTRLQAERTQQVALQKQAELNAMKSRFIAMASHEFRTPLATILGSVDLLRHYQNRLHPDRQQESLKKMDEAVHRMTRMLENVLLMGRADAGQLEFKPLMLALTPFCLGLIDELKSSLSDKVKNIRLVLDLPPPDAVFWLDETLLRNIIGNLLSNALKYTPDGKAVFFSATPLPDKLVISVTDEGIGIPAKDMANLFESFHRASNVGLISGTGLGLSIVKDSVTWHNGSITVTSQINQGSCFTVTLPTPATHLTKSTP